MHDSPDAPQQKKSHEGNIERSCKNADDIKRGQPNKRADEKQHRRGRCILFHFVLVFFNCLCEFTLFFLRQFKRAFADVIHHNFGYHLPHPGRQHQPSRHGNALDWGFQDKAYQHQLAIDKRNKPRSNAEPKRRQ